MRYLIRMIALRHLTASPWRTLLTLVGITLGVALVFAIEVVNGSVMASFRLNIDQLAGKTALVLGEEGGVDEGLLDGVRETRGVDVAAPVIQDAVRDVDHDIVLTVLAIDTLADARVRDYGGPGAGADQGDADGLAFLNDPRAVLVTKQYAARFGIAVGDTITLETTQGRSAFNVRGLLSEQGPARAFGGELLVMDVYAAQIALARGKRFDRIDVVPTEGTRVDALASLLRRTLPEGVTVARPQQRAADTERIIAGFRLGLSMASLVAMLVGGFIVYNALAIAVAQRRREVGILRALGATRLQVTALFVGEGTLLGVLGSALGLALGLAMGRGMLALVGATVSELYLPITPEEVAIAPAQLGLGLSAGVGTSLVASLLPAVRASLVAPASALRKLIDAGDAGLSPRRARTVSVLALSVAAPVGYLAHVHEDLTLGAAVTVLLTLALALLAPTLAALLGALATRCSGGARPETRLGILSFERNAARNAIAIAALGLALANVVSIGCFLQSIKQNTVAWFERSLRADIMVVAGTTVQAKFGHQLPESMEPTLRAMPGVALVNALRMLRLRHQDQPYFLAAHDFPGISRYDEVPVVEGDLASALREVEAGTGVAISETFAHQFELHAGDTLTLQTPAGMRAFRVALVYVDYASELGIVTITRSLLVALWQDHRVDSFWIYAAPGTPIEPLRERIARTLGTEHQLLVLANSVYKSSVLSVFDRAFALTRTMEAVAILVALLGIANTLAVSVIDRTVELGMLKAIGAMRAQLRRMFMVEALLVGVAATLLGLIGGAVLSLYTVKEILRFQIGWNIAWTPSVFTALEVVVVAQVVVLVAAWLPMRRAVRVTAVEALQHP